MKIIGMIFILLAFCLGQILAELCGDVNSNGSIDIVDALLVAQVYVGLHPANFHENAADVNSDGVSNIVDALLIAQYYVGLISESELANTPGCKRLEFKVGVEWVTDYSGFRAHYGASKPNVLDRQKTAERFYIKIVSLPQWSGSFNYGNGAAAEEHFKRSSEGGTDTAYIDAVDFAYFAGHGCGGTGLGRGSCFTFGVNPNDDYQLQATPDLREPRWGDGDLKWIVLDVCSALARKGRSNDVTHTLGERWANGDVMHGLHQILGYRSTAYDVDNTGPYFAKYMTGDWESGKIYNIWYSWKLATIDTQYTSVHGARLAAMTNDTITINDYLPGYGDWSNDPDPNIQILWYYSWVCE